MILSYHFFNSSLPLYCSAIQSVSFSSAPAWLCFAWCTSILALPCVKPCFAFKKFTSSPCLEKPLLFKIFLQSSNFLPVFFSMLASCVAYALSNASLLILLMLILPIYDEYLFYPVLFRLNVKNETIAYFLYGCFQIHPVIAAMFCRCFLHIVQTCPTV